MIARLRRAAWPAGVGMAGIAIYALLQVTKPQPAPSIQAPRPISVEVTPAIRATTRPSVVAYGEVRPAVRTQLVAQVGGKITRIAPAFIEGGQFEPGEVLLSIEDTDYRAAVDERAARVAAAKVDLEQALADADVARKQLAGQANPSPLALKQPQVARAQSALKAAETALALAQTNLERTEISLPFTGRVESQAADLGQYVNPGKVLGTVFGTDYAEVRLALTANQLSALGVPIGFDGAENGAQHFPGIHVLPEIRSLALDSACKRQADLRSFKVGLCERECRLRRLKSGLCPGNLRLLERQGRRIGLACQLLTGHVGICQRLL